MYKYADVEYKGVKFHVTLAVAENHSGYIVQSIYLSDSVNLIDLFSAVFEFNSTSATAAIKKLAIESAHF